MPRMPETFSAAFGPSMVSAYWNQLCHAHGIEGVVRFNPSTYQREYFLRNIGKKLVRASLGGVTKMFEPGESGVLGEASSFEEPKLESFTYDRD